MIRPRWRWWSDIAKGGDQTYNWWTSFYAWSSLSGLGSWSCLVIQVEPKILCLVLGHPVLSRSGPGQVSSENVFIFWNLSSFVQKCPSNRVWVWVLNGQTSKLYHAQKSGMLTGLLSRKFNFNHYLTLLHISCGRSSLCRTHHWRLTLKSRLLLQSLHLWRENTPLKLILLSSLPWWTGGCPGSKRWSLFSFL